MRIALLLDRLYEPRGKILNAILHKRMLEENGHECKLFSLRDEDFEDLRDKGIQSTTLTEFRHLKASPLLWKKPSRIFLGFLPFQLQALVYHQLVNISQLSHFDALIVYPDYHLNWLGCYAKKTLGLKYVIYLDGLYLPQMCKFPHEKLYQWLANLLSLKRSAERADIIAVEVDSLKNLLKEKFKLESIVVKSSIDIDFFREDIGGKRARQKLNIGDDDPLILYVDRIDFFKGIEILIKAFKILRKTFPKAKVLLIGKKASNFYFDQISRNFDDSIIHLEFVPKNELINYYDACDTFATCTAWENGCSHTIVEAQARGKSVVAFDLAAHREVMKDGQTGFLVKEVGEAKAFAEPLLTLLRNPSLAKQMGIEARKNAQNLVQEGKQSFHRFVRELESRL